MLVTNGHRTVTRNIGSPTSWRRLPDPSLLRPPALPPQPPVAGPGLSCAHVGKLKSSPTRGQAAEGFHRPRDLNRIFGGTMVGGSRSNRFIPRLEVLNERVLPSVTAQVDGGILRIIGDQRANEIVVNDNGTDGTDAITVTVDGTALDFTLTEAVTKVVVRAGGQQDTVTYNLTGDFATTRTVDVWLGNQDDTFTGNLGAWAVTADGDLTLLAHGCNGQDVFDVTGTGNVEGDLTVKLYGGNGKDDVGVDLAGLFTGNIDLFVFGGNGKDVVRGELTAATGSTGTVTAKVCGANGVDDLGLIVDGDGVDGLTVDAQLRGGLGKDVFDPMVVSDDVEIVDSQPH